MNELALKHGPVLERRTWRYDEATNDGVWVATDVTERAHEFLFDVVEVAEDVILDDIFKLLNAAPTLKAVLRRDFVEELLAEARKGVCETYQPGYDPGGIEYLELYCNWSFDSAQREFLPVHHLEFHGMGFALREPLDQGHGFVYPAGHRIQWAIDFSPVRQLLALPVRVNLNVTVSEDDVKSKDFGKKLDEFKLAGVSLGQVLHGVLWELSFHGDPDDAAVKRQELADRAAELNRLEEPKT